MMIVFVKTIVDVASFSPPRSRRFGSQRTIRIVRALVLEIGSSPHTPQRIVFLHPVRKPKRFDSFSQLHKENDSAGASRCKSSLVKLHLGCGLTERKSTADVNPAFSAPISPFSIYRILRP
jgi:hypothetical protein